jgi:ABC-type multidrug transport system ATPase subunit
MRLEITHTVVRRGRRTVLEPGRLTAALPCAIAVVGINGSGKSSLFMRLTDTLAGVGSAAMTIDGRRASVAYVPQTPALPGWLGAGHVAELCGLSFDALAAGMPGLHLAEIGREKAAALSVGQRQALAIALALGREADVTILDEPFSALDFRRRIGTLDMLRQWKDAGRAILLSSQSAADLVDLCDRFIVIRDSRYVFVGTRAELAGSPADANPPRGGSRSGGSRSGGREHPDDRRVEQRLLELLTMPVPAMEVPNRSS